MKKIAAIIDFSEMMNDVINKCCDLSKQLNAEIILLYMKPPLSMVVYNQQSLASTKEAFKKSVKLEKKKVQLLKKRMLETGHVVSIKIVDGTQVQSLINCLDLLSPDYVVMATHTRSWIDEKATGSHWTGIISKIKYPLIILPPHVKSNGCFSCSELAVICEEVRKGLPHKK